MRRLVSTVLVVLAIAGLLWPSMPIVHAHADGHDAHHHGRHGRVHVALSAHAPHHHPHADRPEAPSEPEPTDGQERDDERHAHTSADSFALGRARSGVLPAADASYAVLDCGGRPRSGRRPESVRDLVDGPQASMPSACTLDALIVLGRLLL